MVVSLGFIVVVALLVSLRVFWELYQIYSNHRLQRKLENIQEKL